MTKRELVRQFVRSFELDEEALTDFLLLPRTEQVAQLRAFAANLRAEREASLAGFDSTVTQARERLEDDIASLQTMETTL